MKCTPIQRLSLVLVINKTLGNEGHCITVKTELHCVLFLLTPYL